MAASRSHRAKRRAAKARPVRRRKRTGPARQRAGRASAPIGGPVISLEQLFPPVLQAAWTNEASAVQQRNLESAREAYTRRGLVLYLGAGVSCSIGLPTWWHLIQSLTITMMTEQVDTALAELRKLTPERIAQAKLKIQEEVLDGAAADKSILILARSIKNHFGPRLPYEVAQALYRPLFQSGDALLHVLTRGTQGNSLQSYAPLKNSELFKAIVNLARAQRDVRGVQAIVNLNYDDLIEEWMRDSGIRCDTLLSGRRPARDASLPCYHVHGVLPFRKVPEMEIGETVPPEKQRAALEDMRGRFIGNFVFSEDEYHTEYSDPYRWSNLTMINQLGRFSGLFVGLSLQDPNLRRLIDVTHRQFPDILNYAILTRKTPRTATSRSRQSTLQDLFEKVETDSFDDIGVKVIWTDNFDEVPARIFDICNIDRRAGAPGH
jgi:SIR2-like protein